MPQFLRLLRDLLAPTARVAELEYPEAELVATVLIQQMVFDSRNLTDLTITVYRPMTLMPPAGD